MATMEWIAPLAGGAMIGVASMGLWLGLGRIAGISGIASRALTSGLDPQGAWRWQFLIGLLAGGALTHSVYGAAAVLARPWPLLIAAGALVGTGTVLASGCTSGHGVCGLGRRSARSIAATATFMAVGMLTASLLARAFQ